MPRRKGVNTMKRCCIFNIARNMDKFWCADYTQNFSNQGQFLHVIGPFEYLTSDLVHELIRALLELHTLKRHHLHVLIHSRIESLDLSQCKIAANTDSIINMVANRCKRLTKINLSGFSQVSVQTLLNLVSSLPNIQSLKLRQTKCNDRILQAIGSKCLNIRELDIYGCPVSDNGLLNLCFALPDQQPKCLKLIKLDVGHTAVTVKGAREILANIQSLQHLEFYSLCDVLSSLQEEMEKAGKTFNLRSLTDAAYRSEPYHVESMKNLSILCPHLTKVKLFHCIDNEGLLCLSKLQHLCVLHVANAADEFVTFDGIVPFLVTRGKCLEELALYEINNLDIGFIGITCPNLLSFTVVNTVFDHLQFQQNVSISQLNSCSLFGSLERLDIQCLCHSNDLSPSAIKLLLQNCHQLTDLVLSKITSLFDENLLEILQVNPFSSLMRAKFHSCDHITDTAVWELLKGDNVLKELSLIDCKEITRQNFDAFKAHAKKNLFDLSIEWT